VAGPLERRLRCERCSGLEPIPLRPYRCTSRVQLASTSSGGHRWLCCLSDASQPTVRKATPSLLGVSRPRYPAPTVGRPPGLGPTSSRSRPRRSSMRTRIRGRIQWRMMPLSQMARSGAVVDRRGATRIVVPLRARSLLGVTCHQYEQSQLPGQHLLFERGRRLRHCTSKRICVEPAGGCQHSDHCAWHR